MEIRLQKKNKMSFCPDFIGHTRTTHSYLLEAKQQPTCHACQTKYTMKHNLIECTDLTHIKETFYSANNIKELFQSVEIRNKKNVMSFLKAINICKKNLKEISTKSDPFLELFLKRKQIFLLQDDFLQINFQ